MNIVPVAKFNMIEQQLRPWEVLDRNVLSVIGQLDRDDFVPETYKGFKVIRGDEHDLRFTDPKNVIVGLKEKLHLSPITNKLVRDYSGFVIEA